MELCTQTVTRTEWNYADAQRKLEAVMFPIFFEDRLFISKFYCISFFIYLILPFHLRHYHCNCRICSFASRRGFLENLPVFLSFLINLRRSFSSFVCFDLPCAC